MCTVSELLLTINELKKSYCFGYSRSKNCKIRGYGYRKSGYGSAMNGFTGREISSSTLNCIEEPNKRMTTDFLLYDINGRELGVGEVKMQGTAEDLEEEE